MRMSLSSFNRRPSQPVKTLSIGDRAATVIAIAAQKGGVGKTTTAVSLACAWARFHGLRVLLIDLDPQANCALALRAGLGEGGGSLAEVLSEGKGKEVAEIAIDSGVPGLDLTPDDPELQQVEARLAGKIGKELALRHAIERSRTHYDLIVLDCPPHLGPLSVNALAAADQVVVPCTPSALALAGVSGVVQAIEEVRGQLNPNLALLGVVLTRVDARNKATNGAAMSLIEEAFGELVLPEKVEVNNALAGAQLAGQDIFGHAPGSRGARQYMDLAEALLMRIDQGAHLVSQTD